MRELVIRLIPNSKAIQRHWKEYEDLRLFDHDTESDPEVACLVREMTAALELEGLASDIYLLRDQTENPNESSLEPGEHRASRA